jgi:hypothetical protein
MHHNSSDNAVIRVSDESGNVIDTHEHVDDSKSGKACPQGGHPRTFHPISLGRENDFACHWI